MASKSEALSTKEIEELLDAVDQTMERLKTLYEQYFMGIQKQAPSFIHSDVERKLRDLTQLNVRNTGLRYRLATLQQKFGSYNSYWRRTLRQIENGTYLRQLAKVGRDAAKNGADIPEEILAAMPKRMREQVLRDRDNAIAIAKRRSQVTEEGEAPDLQLPDDDIAAAAPARVEAKTKSGAHILEDDGDLDFDSLFAAFQDDAPRAEAPKPEPPKPASAQQTTRIELDPGSSQEITRPVPRIPSVVPAASTSLPRISMRPPGETPAAGMPRPTPSNIVSPLGSATQTGPVPVVAPPTATSAIPRAPAPSQASKPNPIAPGSMSATQPIAVETMSGPFPRENTAAPPSRPTPTAGIPRPTPPAGMPRPTPPAGMPRPTPPAGMPRPPVPPGSARAPTPPPGQRAPGAPPVALKPPPGMTEADVNALHAKYVQAKQMVGEKVDAGSREKLLRTINQTAPKVMEQYKASGVDFTVVVKDNQVVIKAKPKT